MKKLIFTLALALLAGFGKAQQSDNTSKVKQGHLQLSAFGGLSLPAGEYRNGIGRAKNGYFGGLAVDKYFRNGWGLGLDARFLNHDINKFDTTHFSNGYVATDYLNHNSFQHVGVSIGPTYKRNAGRIDLEAYLRGGILFQGFPKYTQSVYINQAVGQPLKLYDNAFTDNPKRITKGLMGLGGIRLSYVINKNWGVFLQGDYLRTFGKQLLGDSSRFSVTGHPVKKPLTLTDVLLVKGNQITNIGDYYESVPVNNKINVSAFNVGAGIRFTFGSKGKRVATKPIAQQQAVQPKEILVVVKDKQTGLALSGVTVKINHNGQDEVSISNADGEATRIKAAEVGDYKISAEKNGIAAIPVSISETDFKNAGRVIYKEIYHDDPRFTLIGETVTAADGGKLPGISTVLTNTSDHGNMSQISDGEAKFVYQLAQQATYRIVANQAGKFSQTEEVSTKGLDRSKTLYVTLKLGINNLGAGVSIVLKNIHYDFDKSDIRTDAERILDNLVNVMAQNPTLRIELSSHTDSRGKDDYNLLLSQKRAEAAVDYLVKSGVERSRLEAKGYGETRLLNKCANGVECSEEAHQANRRTEIKVLKF
ncbi:MAG: OmpA family protein [Bacteroidota bacterium]